MTATVPDLDIQAAAHLLAEGRPDEAARILEGLVAAAPAYAAGLVLLARAYDERGRTSEALDAWHRAHFLVPTSPLVRRERQRLLDALAGGTETETKAEPEASPARAPVDAAENRFMPADPASASVAETGGEPAPEWSLDSTTEASPIDAVWSDEIDDEGAVEVSDAERKEFEGDSPERASGDIGGAARDAGAAIEDAPPNVEASPADAGPTMDPFEWVVAPEVDRTAVVVPPEVAAGDAARLFAEDAFASDSAFEAESVFQADEAVAEEPGLPVDAPSPSGDEGWTLLTETRDPVAPRSGAAEAHVVPPLSFRAPSTWRIVPTADSAGDAEFTDADQSEEEVARADPRFQAREHPAVEDDLDSLIQQIEDAPRIRPDPHFVPADDLETAASADDEDVVSETLAKIYAAQLQFDEAAAVYDKLAEQRPDQADVFRARAAELRQRAGRK